RQSFVRGAGAGPGGGAGARKAGGIRGYAGEGKRAASETASRSLGQEESKLQPCCASRRRRKACSSSKLGVATQLSGKRIRKLDAMTAQSPIATTLLAAMSRPCRKISPSR